MRKILALVLFIGLTSFSYGQTPLRVDWGIEPYSAPPPALDGSRILANVGATAGANTYYYWVVVNYPIGSMSPVGPRVVQNISVPAPGNTVTLTWPAMLGATTYTVIRTITPQFPATCVACASAGLGVTQLIDNGAVLPNNFAASGIQAATGRLMLDNRNFAVPTWTFSPQIVSALTINNLTIDSFTQGSVLFAGIAGLVDEDNTNLFFDDTNNEMGVGTNTPVATLQGVKTVPGATAGGSFIGLRGDAIQPTLGVPIVGTDILTGVYGSSAPDDGLVSSGYGTFGIFNPSGTATAGADMLAAGAKGDWDDTIGVWTEYDTVGAGVLGFVSDNDIAGPDAAVVAMLEAGAVRTTDVHAAFRAIDLSSNANFEIGLDLFYDAGDGVFNQFDGGDIRFQRGGVFEEGDTSILLFYGTADYSGFRLAPTEFGDLPALGAVLNGTQMFCSDCDPSVGGIMAVCTSAGAQTGAIAYRINGGWACISQ